MKKVPHSSSRNSDSELLNLLSIAIKSTCDGFSIWRAVRNSKAEIVDFWLIYSTDLSLDLARTATSRLLHKPITEVVMNGDSERIRNVLTGALKSFETLGAQTLIQNIDGWKTDTESSIIPLTANEVLITYVNKKGSSASINHNQWIFDHDPLTGLVNQVLLDEMLSQALMQLQLRDEPFAFGVIDLDDFKSINKLYGNAVGDILLRNFADLLNEKAKKTDRIIRLGADDFALILRDTHDISEITALTKNLLQAANRGWSINQNEIKISFSAGFILVSDYHAKPREIFNLAQEHMYKIKNKGKNGVVSAVLEGLVAS